MKITRTSIYNSLLEKAITQGGYCVFSFNKDDASGVLLHFQTPEEPLEHFTILRNNSNQSEMAMLLRSCTPDEFKLLDLYPTEAEEGALEHFVHIEDDCVNIYFRNLYFYKADALTTEQIENLKPTFSINGSMEMVEWFQVSRGLHYTTINSGLRHADGETKSPYQYSATTIGEDADLTARKKFTKWWEQKLEP